MSRRDLASEEEPLGMRAKWKISSFALLWLFLLGLAACQSKTISVKNDLLQYLEKAKLWSAKERQINNAIAIVRRDQFVHDDLILETLRPAIGVSREYVEELVQYRPYNPPLINVHQVYTEAWQAHHLAIAAIVNAVEKKDYIQLANANNDLLEAQRLVANAGANLVRLLQEAGIQQAPSPAEQSSPTAGGFEVTP